MDYYYGRLPDTLYIISAICLSWRPLSYSLGPFNRADQTMGLARATQPPIHAIGNLPTFLGDIHIRRRVRTGARGIVPKQTRILIGCVSETVTGGLKILKILWMSYVNGSLA